MKVRFSGYSLADALVVVGKVEGQALSVALNPKLLKEFTQTNKGTAEILLTNSLHPVVFKLSEDFLYLLMPKRR